MSTDQAEPIAIIGFSLKYPQDAVTPESFWRMLAEKRCAMTEWPPDRFNMEAFNHRESKGFIAGAHFLKEDVGLFDAPFFNISATEACAMDPQHRMLLETAYHAFESAGIPIEQAAGSKTGVFTGSMSDDYKGMITRDPDNMPTYAVTGMCMNMIANRLSWFYNLHGPSVNLDTACSSSLTALDMACQSLYRGDSDMALVGGSGMILAPQSSLSLMNMKFLSPDGRCYSFDHRGNGYSRGEGVGVIVIKRLKDAVRDDNLIRAVIRSTGSNQDGHTPGLTQPSQEMQTRLISDTYKKAGLDFASTRFFEAHGTGTSLGDPLEAGSVGDVFRTFRSSEDPMYIGAVKSNIGHLEGGSGISSVIKTIMVLEKALIPPNANFESLNPKIDTDFLKIKIPDRVIPWPVSGLRRASVASFGFGGSNAHAVIDDACNFLESQGYRARHSSQRDPPFDIREAEVKGASTLSRAIDRVRSPVETASETMNSTHELGVSDGLALSRAIDQIRSPSRTASGTKTNSIPNGTGEFTATSNGHFLDLPSSEAQLPNGSLANSYASHYKMPNGVLVNGDVSKRESHNILFWSAAEESGVRRLIDISAEYFAKLNASELDENEFLSELAYTLAFRRSRLSWKAFAVVDSIAALKQLRRVVSKPIRSNQLQGVCLVFTGQGAQYSKMGLELMHHNVFRETLESCNQALQTFGCQWSLSEILADSGANHDINEPQYAQPLTTALQISLFELLSALGIKASSVVGHSSGEIAAAYAIGALTLSAACQVSYFRGLFANKLKQSTTASAMLAVDLSDVEAKPYLQKINSVLERESVHIACLNSPSNTTISGGEQMIDQLKDILTNDKIVSHKLKTGVAYHSPQMNGVALQYQAAMEGIEPSKKPSRKMTFISSVTGGEIRNLQDLSDPQYWVENMIKPVHFSQAISRAIHTREAPNRKLGARVQQPVFDLIEVGPHSALRRPCREILRDAELSSTVRYSETLDRRSNSAKSLLTLVAKLHTLGYPVNLHQVVRSQNHQKHDPEIQKALTQMPEYPFNHAKRYWFETSNFRNLRLRKHKRLELLGTPTLDSTPLEARWRKFLDVNETPWIKDHAINEKVLYPATGMISMALEAARQLTDRNEAITGYSVKDAIFMHPIMINDDDRVEVELSLRRIQNASEKNMPSYEYSIRSVDAEQSWEHCRGLVSVESKGQSKEWNPQQSFEASKASHFNSVLEEAGRSCSYPVSASKLYQLFEANSMSYGPSFQLLSNIAWNGTNTAIGEIQPFEWTLKQSQNARQDHLAHPATLDVVGHLAWVALTEGAEKIIVNGAAVTRINRLWISNEGIAYPETRRLKVCAEARFRGMRGTSSSIFALDEAGNVRLWISGQETTSISGNRPGPAEPDCRQLCYSVQWKPDIELLSNEQLSEYWQISSPFAKQPPSFFQDVDTLLLQYARSALAEVGASKAALCNPQMQRYVQWLKWQLQCHESSDAFFPTQNTFTRSTDVKTNSNIAQSLCGFGREGSLLVMVGERLAATIQGAVDPWEQISPGAKDNAYHKFLFDNVPCARQLKKYLKLLTHKQPTMRICELSNSGNPFMGLALAALLGTSDNAEIDARFATYHFASGLDKDLETSRQRFANYGSKISFGTLDIKKTLVEQGYEEETYDLVIAAWAPRAIRDLGQTIRNTGKLMRSGGRLVLLDTADLDSLRNGFVLRLLPEWNDNEDCGRSYNGIPEQEWVRLLESNGFNGVYSISSNPRVSLHNALRITTASRTQMVVCQPIYQSIRFIINSKSTLQQDLAKDIRQRLGQAISDRSQLVTFDNVSTANEIDEGSLAVFLPEIEEPVLPRMDDQRFQQIREFLLRTENVIWVSSAKSKTLDLPSSRLIEGLARVVRVENIHSSLVTAFLEDHYDEPQLWATHITNIIQAQRPDIRRTGELDYQERSGILNISRVIINDEMNASIFDKSALTQKARPFRQAIPLTLNIARPGFLDSTIFVEDLEQQTKPLAGDEIEIEVKVVGLNFRDLMVMLGKLNDSDTLGWEASGIVSRVGKECQRFQPGDRVCAILADCIGTFARCHHNQAVRIPDGSSFGQAAAVALTGVTAYHSLVKVARLRKHESILIHSGAGGTGQMAIQIAKMIGAEVYVTVGTDEKKDLIKRLYNVPDDHILYSRNASFGEQLLRITQNKGVDVILNSLSGEGLMASWECIAPFGRFIEIGRADIEGNSKLPMMYFAKNVSFSLIAIDHLGRTRPAIMRESLEPILQMLDAGIIEPASPIHKFPVSRLEDAFRLMQSGKHSGKIIINLQPTDVVPTRLRQVPTYSFPANATYVIAGGLGGLGRSAARWMASMGAKNLILLSRSGPKSEAAQALVQELSEQGVHVKTPKCDLTLKAALATALEACSDLPPIKGCIQGTMVLQDAVFANMTFSQWQTTVDSKIHSTENLHALLPTNLDFFIILSSMAGVVGSISQANYAAANTFQDAFAQYRRSLGQRAIALDLGWMGDVGVIAENEKYARGREAAADMALIAEREFHALLEHYCDPSLPISENIVTAKPQQQQQTTQQQDLITPIATVNTGTDIDTHQLLVGLMTPAEIKSLGTEVPEWIAHRRIFSTLPQEPADIDISANSPSSHGHSTSSAKTDWLASFTRARKDSPEAAVEVAVAGLTQKLARALGVPVAEMDTEGKPVAALGVDSLLAIELRNWFALSLGVDVAVFDITAAASLRGLAGLAVRNAEGGRRGSR